MQLTKHNQEINDYFELKSKEITDKYIEKIDKAAKTGLKTIEVIVSSHMESMIQEFDIMSDKVFDQSFTDTQLLYNAFTDEGMAHIYDTINILANVKDKYPHLTIGPFILCLGGLHRNKTEVLEYVKNYDNNLRTVDSLIEFFAKLDPTDVEVKLHPYMGVSYSYYMDSESNNEKKEMLDLIKKVLVKLLKN